MNKFSKVALITAVVLLPVLAMAQGAGISEVKPLSGDTNIATLMGKVANWATGLLIALSTLFIIFAAFLYVTAGADPGNVDKAKTIIMYAVIGIVVALLSQVVAGVVKAVIGTG